MFSMVRRLVLSGGVVLQSGTEWPDVEPTAGSAFVVGPIFFVPTTTLRLAPAEDDEDDSDSEVLETPAHYEVWQVPQNFLEALYHLDFATAASSLTDTPELICLRVWLSGNVQLCEERWPTQMAAKVLMDRLLDQAEAAGMNVDSVQQPSDGQQQLQPVAS